MSWKHFCYGVLCSLHTCCLTFGWRAGCKAMQALQLRCGTLHLAICLVLLPPPLFPPKRKVSCTTRGFAVQALPGASRPGA